MRNQKQLQTTITAAFLILSLSAYPQQLTLRGQIIGFGADSIGISYAHLFLSHDNTGTVTNTEGFYEWTLKQPALNHTIDISAVGYHNRVQSKKVFCQNR
jgi:hypothetical protein